VHELLVRLRMVCKLFGYSYPSIVGALETHDTSALNADEKRVYDNFISRYEDARASFNIYA